ncbi:hypothetical protein [Chryseobacterium camelliae]|uniref:hypothetical protein n=1 Tax=Chryseobacterium camelliae TaxID=1265445 RepID=UPI000C1C922F|nr:hypothetical protein [Chryseobacterium camelliae]
MMKNRNYKAFRSNYEGKISKKLEIDREEFYHDFYIGKPPFGLAVFGFSLFMLALYFMFNAHWMYGIFIMIPSLFFLQGSFKKKELALRVSKNGLWTAEFGFIYFRHIDHFEFYRYIGKYSSERMKIHMKNYKMYPMEMPFLELHISHIDRYGDLKNILDSALIAAHKRNANKKRF